MGLFLLICGVGICWQALERMDSDEPSAVHQPISHQLFASAPGNFVLGVVLAVIGLCML